MYKIIIVEDDKEIREELKILLENSGHQVKLVTEFENVVQKIIDEQAHLVLLDINLPNKSGYEICSKIRTKSNIPIIFVTSRNNSMDELKGIMLGGDDYIEKPYNVPILLARIQNLLNRTYQKENKESKIEYKGVVLDILKSTIKYQEKENEPNFGSSILQGIAYYYNKIIIAYETHQVDYYVDGGQHMGVNLMLEQSATKICRDYNELEKVVLEELKKVVKE